MRKIVVAIVVGISLFSLTGCTNVSSLNSEVVSLKQEKKALEKEIAELKSIVKEDKIELGLETYIVTLNIKQSHFTLDIGQHAKDAMNDVEIPIQVSKEFYDSVEVGDVLDDSFRVGSFIMKGSLGSWKVTIANKEIE